MRPPPASVRVAIELAEQSIAVLLGPVGQLLDEVLNLVAGGISESLRAAEVDGVGLYEFGVEFVLADDLAETVANLRVRCHSHCRSRFVEEAFQSGFGTVPISSTEQMPMP